MAAIMISSASDPALPVMMAVLLLAAVAVQWRAFLGIALAAVGVGLSIYGQRKQDKAERKVANQNQEIAEAQAQDALDRGREAEQEARLAGRQVIGAQRAGFAGQGVVLDEGTPLEIQLQTVAQAERDALTERNNAMREAWGFRVQRDQFGAHAAAIRSSSRFRTASTLVTGGLAAYRRSPSFGTPSGSLGTTGGFRVPAPSIQNGGLVSNIYAAGANPSGVQSFTPSGRG